MAARDSYVEKVDLFAQGCTRDTVFTALSDEYGVTQPEIAALPPAIAAVRAGMLQALDADAAQTEASTALQDCLKANRENLSKLRTALNNNLKRNHPVFKQLGLTESQPAQQEQFIGYCDKVFALGEELEGENVAVLAKLKWDKARFTRCRGEVQELRETNQAQEAAKGAYTAAISTLYDRIERLDQVYRPLAKNARSALRDNPGELEALGLKAGLPVMPRRPVPTAARKTSAPKPPTDSSA
jgi:hypothetical protein